MRRILICLLLLCIDVQIYLVNIQSQSLCLVQKNLTLLGRDDAVGKVLFDEVIKLLWNCTFLLSRLSCLRSLCFHFFLALSKTTIKYQFKLVAVDAHGLGLLEEKILLFVCQCTICQCSSDECF